MKAIESALYNLYIARCISAPVRAWLQQLKAQLLQPLSGLRRQRAPAVDTALCRLSHCVDVHYESTTLTSTSSHYCTDKRDGNT